MTRTEAAERIGFPKCPSCKQIRALHRFVIAGEGTRFELSVDWCAPCVARLRSVEELLEASEQMRRVLEAMESIRKSEGDLVLSVHGSTHQQATHHQEPP